MNVLVRACVLFLLVGQSSCATESATTRAAGPLLDPGLIRAPSVLPYDFQWRQHVTASWPTGTRSFDAVVQKRNGELLLLGLSPMGMPGFILTLHENKTIDVVNHTGHPLPFRAEYIIADVQRVLYPWLATPPVGANGERRGQVGSVTVTERYARGVLLERTFVRGADSASEHAAGSGSVQIQFQGMRPNADVPSRVTVDNGWFGYRLLIETLAESRLDAKPE
jgi:hypothetical protein